jgi:hypothetical protein
LNWTFYQSLLLQKKNPIAQNNNICGATTISKMAISIKGLFVTFSITTLTTLIVNNCIVPVLCKTNLSNKFDLFWTTGQQLFSYTKTQ